ncbi:MULTISPECIES: GerMN domain-containing protein [unclassified Moraxella]|uniref:GerMN domain-containing protein n=1 Tax=unclassified Moraxella TaxID=2685852 RepID=UPI001D12C82F
MEIESPQDVIDFDYNITKTAEQFPSVRYVQICINGINNYQTTFFTNEPIKKCDF